MNDLLFQNFSTPQNNLQPGFNWTDLGNSGAPDEITPISFITGIMNPDGNVSTINPPVSGSHMLVFILDAPVTFESGGNLQLMVSPVAFETSGPVFAFYNDKAKAYYVFGTVGS